MLLDIGLFFGRFHPLIVHLPIGFLLLAVFFSALSTAKRFRALRVAVPASLLIGSISAAFASITGYVLSLSGDYNLEVLDDHMWAGILTTAVSFLAYFISIKKIPLAFFQSRKTLIASAIIIFIFISITGHLGGNLTHGEDYLSTAVLFDKEKQRKQITNINEAMVFADLVHPILEDKCSSCHNPSKKKGKLSVATYEALLKGGKHGVVVKPGDPSGSELMKRVSLNPKDKKFMPTDGKTPLTAEETAIIKWWIEKEAAGPDKKLAAASPPEEIRKFAAAYLGAGGEQSSENNMAVNIAAPPVRRELVEQLRTSGFAIKYLNFKPDLLDVTLPPSANKNAGGLLKALLQVKENILWLNVADNNVSDQDMEVINQFTNLERLNLNNNPITDNGISRLTNLGSLASINLYNTKISKDCLAHLQKLSNLKTVYAWGTAIRQQDAASDAAAFRLVTSAEAE